MTTAEPLTDRALSRLDALIEEQERLFMARQPRSTAMVARARRTLPGGVTSSWQIARPQTVWIERGQGSKVFDVDGTEYVDLHGGYGVMLVGHAHPKVVEAVQARVARGTHFAQPTEDAVVVAEELARRFGLPLWRFANSGTEATMDAVHLMRAATGRPKIAKVEGSYHGHHDSVMVSVYEDVNDLGPPDHPFSVLSGAGIPNEVAELTVVVPYNDLDALDRVLAENAGEVAGMIMEPVMMNIGIVQPDPGYLEGVREITRRHGALLTFDEVKTGFTVAPGGATERYGVTPDLVCLAKAMGGGLPCGAIGGSAEVMGLIERGDYEQVGTFNGNPLMAAASRAVLTEILVPEAYARIDGLQRLMVEGCERVIAEYDLPAHIVALGAKGCIVFSPTRIRNYRDFVRIDDRYSHAHWLIQHNGGVFLPPWGKSEQWLLSVQHTEDDVQRFLANFETFGRAVRS